MLVRVDVWGFRFVIITSKDGSLLSFNPCLSRSKVGLCVVWVDIGARMGLIRDIHMC